MSNTFEEIMNTQTPQKSVEKSQPTTVGFIWINMLVKYDLDGNATIITSYSNPAKDSTIKRYVKPKVKKKEVKVEKVEEKSLF